MVCDREVVASNMKPYASSSDAVSLMPTNLMDLEITTILLTAMVAALLAT